ncbi:hypothetical protein [Archaeoglobus sp.]
MVIISRWKATCGISLHAKLIANEFMKIGHEIVVFAPKLVYQWHHVVIGEDEPFVIRCYEENEDGREGKFDPNYALSQHIDYLIVESYPCLPHRDVERIVRRQSSATPIQMSLMP